jgi:hypothetical protein
MAETNEELEICHSLENVNCSNESPHEPGESNEMKTTDEPIASTEVKTPTEPVVSTEPLNPME